MIEIGLIGRLPVKTGVWASPIVEVQISADRGARLADAVVGVQIDVFVFDRFPDALDEDVVAPRALAIHADRDGVCDQHAGEAGAGELTSLIGIEYLGPGVFSPLPGQGSGSRRPRGQSDGALVGSLPSHGQRAE